MLSLYVMKKKKETNNDENVHWRKYILTESYANVEGGVGSSTEVLAETDAEEKFYLLQNQFTKSQGKHTIK